jgi:hypothetical protein
MATSVWPDHSLRAGFGVSATFSTTMSGAWHRTCPRVAVGSIDLMADAASLDERLEQIGAQLDWVRDYL